MMKIMRTNKSSSSIFNKKSVVIPDKGIFGSGYFKRHHMIGYSIVSDNARAPGPSNSIYISKTNQKFSISYIPILRHYRKKIFRNKSLDQHGSCYVCYVHSEDSSLLQFTLHTSLRSLWQFKKVNVIPYPSTLNYKLSVRTATSDQLNIC